MHRDCFVPKRHEVGEYSDANESNRTAAAANAKEDAAEVRDSWDDSSDEDEDEATDAPTEDDFLVRALRDLKMLPDDWRLDEGNASATSEGDCVKDYVWRLCEGVTEALGLRAFEPERWSSVYVVFYHVLLLQAVSGLGDDKDPIIEVPIIATSDVIGVMEHIESKIEAERNAKAAATAMGSVRVDG